MAQPGGFPACFEIEWGAACYACLVSKAPIRTSSDLKGVKHSGPPILRDAGIARLSG